MNLTSIIRRAKIVGLLWGMGVGLAACTQGIAQHSARRPTPAQPKPILVDGSSTVYPISTAVVQRFRAAPEGQQAEIKTQFSGTSAGFRRFCAGETDISNASRPILHAEKAACVEAGVAFIELPIAFDALTLVVHPQNTWATDITPDELERLWAKQAQGQTITWKQLRPNYPNQSIQLFGAGANSGTYDYFNEVVMGNPTGSRTDYVASEDDTVLVRGISQTPNAIGYIPYAYYVQNAQRLKALAVRTKTGAIAPTPENVQTAVYQPFSRPLLLYINAKAAQDKPELKAFVEFYLRNAQQLVSSVGYVPLPDEGYRLAEIQFTRGEIGTAFNGVPEPNVTIAEVLRRQTNFGGTAQVNNP